MEQQQNENVIQPEQAVQIEVDRVYGEELEERLERVYFKLVELNANKRWKYANTIICITTN